MIFNPVSIMVSMGFVTDLPTKDTDLVFTDSNLSDPHYIESVIIALISRIEKLHTGLKHQTQIGHLGINLNSTEELKQLALAILNEPKTTETERSPEKTRARSPLRRANLVTKKVEDSMNSNVVRALVTNKNTISSILGTFTDWSEAYLQRLLS
jgi:hypothetical protein